MILPLPQISWALSLPSSLVRRAVCQSHPPHPQEQAHEGEEKTLAYQHGSKQNIINFNVEISVLHTAIQYHSMYGSMHLRAHNRCHGYTIATIAKVYSDISCSTHHIIDKFLNGIVVTDIDLVERYIYLHMLWSCLTWLSNPLARRSNSWLAKLQMKQTLFLSCSVRNCRGRELIIIKISTDSGLAAHPLIPELREGVDNDTKDNVETNGGHNDEEGHVIEEP